MYGIATIIDGITLMLVGILEFVADLVDPVDP